MHGTVDELAWVDGARRWSLRKRTAVKLVLGPAERPLFTLAEATHVSFYFHLTHFM